MKHKYITIVSMIFSLVLLQPLSALAVDSPGPQFVRAFRTTSVYVVIDGKRVPVPRKFVKRSGRKMSEVAVVSKQELREIPLVKHVKVEGSDTVYRVTGETKKVVTNTNVQTVTIPEDQFAIYRLSTYTVGSSANEFKVEKGELKIIPFPREEFGNAGTAFYFNNRGHIAVGNTFWDGKTLTKINVLENHDVIIMGLNDNDQIVGGLQPKDIIGDSFGSPDLNYQAFIWENGVAKVIPQLTTEHRVFAITNDGTIWAYHLGKKIPLPGIGFDFSTEKGIGLVSLKDGVLKEHVRTRGKGGGGFKKVNNNGVVLGYESYPVENAAPDSAQIIWQNGQFTTFHEKDSGYVSLQDINDAGQVIADSSDGATIQKNGAVTKLSGFESSAMNINNNGIISGSSRVSTPDYEFPIHLPVLWKNNQLVIFEKLFPESKPNKDISTTIIAINDRNQILGQLYDGTHRLFIATLPDNIAPQFTFKLGGTNIFRASNDLPEATQVFTIEWEDSDPEDNATVSLYSYPAITTDIDTEGALLGTFKENDDGAQDKFTIQRSSLAPNEEMLIYAVIDDGVNPPVRVYSRELALRIKQLHTTCEHRVSQSNDSEEQSDEEFNCVQRPITNPKLR
ncbi:hypothetical protein KBD59_03340 [Candidatus Gracilibacteria bacterium]|nr:hypothetical protein [Candidatus Gracilibacteria bacterium]